MRVYKAMFNFQYAAPFSWLREVQAHPELLISGIMPTDSTVSVVVSGQDQKEVAAFAACHSGQVMEGEFYL